jgi:hypothetical protein
MRMPIASPPAALAMLRQQITVKHLPMNPVIQLRPSDGCYSTTGYDYRSEDSDWFPTGWTRTTAVDEVLLFPLFQ